MTTHLNYSNVPDELQERDQWLMWDASADAPRRPHWRGDFGISWSDPADWHSFEEIDEHPRGMYGALDLDGCLDDEGRPKDWLPALDEFIEADAYIERSPSDGLHVPLVGFEPPDWWDNTPLDDKHEGVGAYDKKFMTFTGDTVDVAGETVAEDVDASGWLAEAYEALTGGEPPIRGDGTSGRAETLEIDVYDVISSHKHPEEERVPHPFHGSGTGSNFKVDEGAETFRCWRHSATGNALHLIGMEQGIIACGEWDGAGGLSDDTWSEIFEVARDAVITPEPGCIVDDLYHKSARQ